MYDAQWSFYKSVSSSMKRSTAVNCNCCQNVLREEIKEKFKYSVDRTSPSNKLRDFMDWSVDIIKDIKYQRRIYGNPLARFFVQAKYVVLLLVILSWIPCELPVYMKTLCGVRIIMSAFPASACFQCWSAGSHLSRCLKFGALHCDSYSGARLHGVSVCILVSSPYS